MENSQHCTGSRRCHPAGATPGLHCENYWLEIILQKLQSVFIFKSLDFHSPSKTTLEALCQFPESLLRNWACRWSARGDTC